VVAIFVPSLARDYNNSFNLPPSSSTFFSKAPILDNKKSSVDFSSTED
jgi:hypothetical protein